MPTGVCYNDTNMSDEDLMWLISIDAVKNNQDIMNIRKIQLQIF